MTERPTQAVRKVPIHHAIPLSLLDAVNAEARKRFVNRNVIINQLIKKGLGK